MKKKHLLHTAAAVLLCGVLAVAGQPPLEPVRTYADSQADYEQKIKDLDNKLNDLDAKIAAAGADIENNKEVQDDYWSKLVTTQEKIDTQNLLVAAKEEEIVGK
ncbi:MAG: hypothetical protein IJT87_03810, partial [Ruminiclostridium sp.]|nr:hypothetical protein [Ruminiclostridium sp.]